VKVVPRRCDPARREPPLAEGPAAIAGGPHWGNRARPDDAGGVTRRMRSWAVMVVAMLCATSACENRGAGMGPGVPGEGAGGAGGTATGVLAFLVPPNNVGAGSPIDPEVKVEALDAAGSVLTQFSGTVRVALGSSASGGSLSGTMSVAATSGVAFFGTLVISSPGSGYTLVASAPGFVSVTSAPFTVFGATRSDVGRSEGVPRPPGASLRHASGGP
jgi:hypothetical protein